MQDFAFYFGPGWKHIIGKDALDHQLFIAALAAIYLLKDWKQVLVLVTAFTIGFDSKWVEFLIPMTIVITAVSNLFQKKFTPRSIRINYFLALAFGLIHGMGFANYIRFAIEGSDQHIGWSLFGFNVGLEAGQLVVVTSLLLLSHLIVTILKVNRRDWVIFLSAAVFSIALKMSLDRLPIKKKSHEETLVIQLPAADPCRSITGTEYSKQCQLQPRQQV
jgi:HupE / UreJ protein